MLNFIGNLPTGSKLDANQQTGIYVERYVYTLPSWAPGGLPAITVTYQVTENKIIIEASRIDYSKAAKRGR